MDNFLKTEHPYNNKYSVPTETRVLIVGTAPPPRFCKSPWACEDDLDFDFFYGSGSNWMWGILPQALKEPDALPETLSPYDCELRARELLERHGLWMRDVLGQIKRKPGKESSARDEDIEPPNCGDFEDFKITLEAAPELRAIAVTSEVAFKWLIQAFECQNIVSIDGSGSLKNWQSHRPSEEISESDFWIEKYSRSVINFELKGTRRKIDIYILPSPSSRRAGLTNDCKTNIYSRVLKAAGAY